MILNEKIKSNFFTSIYNKKEQPFSFSNKKISLSDKRNSTYLKLIKFINQNKNFYINNSFDEIRSKKFLDSKDIAMSEMHFDDELDNNIEVIKKTVKIDNNDNFDLYKNVINKLDTEIKINNKNKKIKNNENKYFSTTKLKTPFINEKTSYTDKMNYNSTNKNIDNDSNDSNFIYKFIIDNANDSEEKFLKKLKKEIKDVELKRKNSKLSEKFFSKFSESKIEKKKNNKRQSLFKGANPFIFSEKAKNLMIDEKIEESSINSSYSENKIQSKISDIDIDKDKIMINNIFKEKESENKALNKSFKNEELDSDKESLLNILSGLMQ